jgi:tetrahydromethanopterin S-methyltransferase subunit F
MNYRYGSRSRRAKIARDHEKMMLEHYRRIAQNKAPTRLIRIIIGVLFAIVLFMVWGGGPILLSILR